MCEINEHAECQKGNLITSWGQLRLICPCGGSPNLPYDFDIVKKGKEVVYTCTNSSCSNFFSSDILTKIIDWVNDYYEKHGTLNGFRHTFAYHNRKIRIKFIEMKKVTETYETVVLEIWSTQEA